MLVDEGVPFPKQYVRRRTRYQFEQFKPGSSVLVPPTLVDAEISSMKQAAWRYGRRHDQDFKMGYDDEGKLRLWRLR